jgi:hypothetical protein
MQFEYIPRDTYHVEYDLDHQATARTDCDLFSIPQVGDGDLETVAARAWIVVYL